MIRILSFIGVLALTLGASQLLRFHAFQIASGAPMLALRRTAPKSPIVGKLDIPSLHLSLPILDNDDSQSLALSVGHIPGTDTIGSLGNAGIAGHRDSSFRPLRNIRVGDRIETHTGQDAVYVVRSIQIVEPTDTRLLAESSSPMLTLVTCYPFNYVGSAPRRFVIQAEMSTR